MKIGIAGNGSFFKEIVSLFLLEFGEDKLIAVSKENVEVSTLYSSFEEIPNEEEVSCFLLVDWMELIQKNQLERFDFINSHGGLLPKWRGYHGNGWALINGEQKIGLTFHLVNAFLDDGPILLQKEFIAKPNETFNDLQQKYRDYYLKNVVDLVKRFIAGDIEARQQNEKEATYVGKRNIRDCYIEWGRTSSYILNFIRFLSPPAAPGAFTIYNNQRLVILKARKAEFGNYEETPGKVLLIDEKRGVLVKTGDSSIWLLEINFMGKSQKANEFFRSIGYRLGIDLIGMYLKSIEIC